MFDSVGTLVIQTFQDCSNSSWRQALRIGRALSLVVWQEMNASRTPSLSVWITMLHPASISFQSHIAQKNAKNSHSKIIVFLFDTLIFVNKSSSSLSEKKFTFSPKLFTRAAPTPATEESPPLSWDASVKMNQVMVLFLVKVLGTFICSSPQKRSRDVNRTSDNLPSPVSYACCVTAERQRLATRPKIWPDTNCIRPLSRRASFLVIRQNWMTLEMVSSNSSARFSVLSIRTSPWCRSLTSTDTPSAVTAGENGGALGPSSANFQPSILNTVFTVKSTDWDSATMAKEIKSSK